MRQIDSEDYNRTERILRNNREDFFYIDDSIRKNPGDYIQDYLVSAIQMIRDKI